MYRIYTLAISCAESIQYDEINFGNLKNLMVLEYRAAISMGFTIIDAGHFQG